MQAASGMSREEPDRPLVGGSGFPGAQGADANGVRRKKQKNVMPAMDFGQVRPWPRRAAQDARGSRFRQPSDSWRRGGKDGAARYLTKGMAKAMS